MRQAGLRVLVMLLVVVAGCATAPGSDPSPTTVLHAHLPTLFSYFGQFRGDPDAGCTWIDNKGTRLQAIWPRDVKVAFSPLRLVQAGKVVARDGDFIHGEMVSDQPVVGKPGCPVREARAMASVHSVGRTRPPQWP